MRFPAAPWQIGETLLSTTLLSMELKHLGERREQTSSYGGASVFASQLLNLF